MGVPIFRSPSPESTRANQKDNSHRLRTHAGVRRRTQESRNFTAASQTAASNNAQTSPSRTNLHRHHRRGNSRGVASWERYAARHALPPPPVLDQDAVLIDSTQTPGNDYGLPVTLVLPDADTLSHSPLPMTREPSSNGANANATTDTLAPLQDRSGRSRRMEVESLQQMGEQMIADARRRVAPAANHESTWVPSTTWSASTARWRANTATEPDEEQASVQRRQLDFVRGAQRQGIQQSSERGTELRMLLQRQTELHLDQNNIPREAHRTSRQRTAADNTRRLARSRTIREYQGSSDNPPQVERPGNTYISGDSRYDRMTVDGSVADGPLLEAPAYVDRAQEVSMLTVPGFLPDLLFSQNTEQNSASPDFTRWDTMLSTIAPDRTLPSADSSFTSATASASFTNSRSQSAGSSQNGDRARSVPTSSSSVSARGNNTRYEEECDSDGSSSREDGNHRRIVRLGYSSIHHHPRDPTSRTQDRVQGTDDPRIPSYDLSQYTRMDAHYSRIRSRRSRVMPDELFEPSAELDARRERTLPPMSDEELEAYRPWVERLASREDIPDEWWMSVGLTPSLRSGVDAGDRRATSGNETGRQAANDVFPDDPVA